MEWLLPSVIASLCSSLVLSLVYLYLFLHYRDRYMLCWTASWGLYTLRYAAVLTSVLVGGHPLLVFFVQAFAISSGVLLYFGAVMYRGKPLGKGWHLVHALAIVYVAAAVSLKVPFLWLTLPAFMFMAYVYIRLGILYWPSPDFHSLPRIIVSSAFILWGLHKLNYPFLRPVEWFAPWGYLIAAVLGLVIAVGMLIIYFEDLYRKVRQQNRTLEMSQELGKLGTWELSIPTNELTWSKETCRIFGVPETEPIDFQSVLEIIHPEDVERISSLWEVALKTGVFDDEYRIMVDEKTKWIHSKAEFFYDQNNQPEYVLGLSQDITEKRLMQESQLRNNQLSALGELAAGVAHEINNPISGVINYAQILQNKSVNEQRQNDILSKIIREGNRIALIVSSLLSFARKDLQAQTQLSVASIVQEPINLMMQHFKSDAIHLEVSVDENLPKIFGNASQLEQVVINLLSNARHALNKKFSKRDHYKFIIITAEEVVVNMQSRIRLVIEDRGCGIPQENLEKIFHPFFTTKPTGVGTGLGLSITNEILNRHNATLQIESKVGEFTRITILFPTA